MIYTEQDLNAAINLRNDAFNAAVAASALAHTQANPKNSEIEWCLAYHYQPCTCCK